MTSITDFVKNNQLSNITIDPKTNPNFLISPLFADINSTIYDKIVNSIIYKENPYFSKSTNLFSTLNPEKIIDLPANSTMLENLVVKNIYVENILANSINSSFFKNKIYSYTNVENTNQNFSKFILCRYFSGVNYNLNIYKNNYNNLKQGYNIGNFQQNGTDVNGNPNYLEATSDPNYINSTPIINLLNYENMLDYELNENILQNSIQNRISYLWDYRKYSTQYFNNLVESQRQDTDLFDPEYSVNLYSLQKPLISLGNVNLLNKQFWLSLQQLNLVGPVYNNQGILQNKLNNIGDLTGYDVQQKRIYPQDLESVIARYDANNVLTDLDNDFWQSQTVINTGSRYSSGTSLAPQGICLNQQGEVSSLDNTRIIQTYENKQFKYNMIISPVTENTYTINEKKLTITTSSSPFTTNFVQRKLTLIKSVETGNIIRFNINSNQNNYINCLNRLQYLNSLYNLGVDIKNNWTNKNAIKALLNSANLYFINDAVNSSLATFDEYYKVSLLKRILDHSFYYNLNFSFKVQDSYEIKTITVNYEGSNKQRVIKTDDINLPYLLKPYLCVMRTLRGNVADFNKALCYDSICLVY